MKKAELAKYMVEVEDKDVVITESDRQIAVFGVAFAVKAGFGPDKAADLNDFIDEKAFGIAKKALIEKRKEEAVEAYLADNPAVVAKKEMQKVKYRRNAAIREAKRLEEALEQQKKYVEEMEVLFSEKEAEYKKLS